MSKNKFSVLFNDSMSQEQILLILFTLTDYVPDNEIPLLKEAAQEAESAENKRFWENLQRKHPYLGRKQQTTN